MEKEPGLSSEYGDSSRDYHKVNLVLICLLSNRYNII